MIYATYHLLREPETTIDVDWKLVEQKGRSEESSQDCIAALLRGKVYVASFGCKHLPVQRGWWLNITQ